MQIISNTSAEEYNAYVNLLRKAGFLTVSVHETDGNLYAEMMKGSCLVYVYFIHSAKEARVIKNNSAVSSRSFSYTTPKEAAVTEPQIWFYGLNMDPYGYNTGTQKEANTSGYTNCGQLQIIRCADNSLILIDGGVENQVDAERLNAFLHQITGKEINEPIRISCWYVTHAHSDHLMGVYALLKAYPAVYRLERLLVNFPDMNIAPFKSLAFTDANTIAKFIRNTYPDCIELKAHTGQLLRISDVTLQILFTHEDLVNASNGKTKVSDVNDTSTVAKMELGGMSVMILGDINEDAEAVMVSSFTEETLRSDIVQVAHHGLNYLTVIYERIHASIAVFPQTEKGAQLDNPAYGIARSKNYEVVLKYSASDQIYFSGQYELTVGFEKTSEGIRVYSPEPDPSATD